MKILIVDDEALARQRLQQLIQRLPSPALHNVTEAANADEAWQRLQDASPATVPEVLLLDVRMPGPNAHAGLHLTRKLRDLPSPPAVIFVTAHEEHALKAFELDAVDYLTKPVRLERLQAALQRAESRLQARELAQSQAMPAEPMIDATLVINERGRVLRLPLPELLYLRAEQKLVQVRCTHESYLVDDSLAELEARLKRWRDRFIRVHRNAVVALHAIRALELRELPAEATDEESGAESYETWAVRICPPDIAPLYEWLAVSRRQVAAVKAALQSVNT